MLIRRLKERLRDGGRKEPFRCIATSATLSSGEGEGDMQAVAEFARELFGEPFSAPGVIFGKSQQATEDERPRLYHAFLRALEGAFLVHRNGADAVVLNRKSEIGDESTAFTVGNRAVPRVRATLLRWQRERQKACRSCARP